MNRWQITPILNIGFFHNKAFWKLKVSFSGKKMGLPAMIKLDQDFYRLWEGFRVFSVQMSKVKSYTSANFF